MARSTLVERAISIGCAASAPVVVFLVMTFSGVLPYIQVVLAVMLIGSILLQQTGAGLGGAFGGDNFSASFHTRRGAEKYLFYASIILGILFVLSAFLALVTH
jgi:protein translocase SecG subunit